MSQNRVQYTGTGKVFAFTLRQVIFNKANMITMILLLALSIFGMPLMSLIGGGTSGNGGADAGKNDIMAVYEQAGITQEQAEILNAEVSTDVDSVQAYEEAQTRPDFGTRYMVQYVYAIIMMILGIFTASYIIHAIIEEKDSKLVELLMVSVKPMALIIGKILAMMVYIFGLILLMCIGFGISSVVSQVFLHTASLGDTLASMGISLDSLNFSPFLLIAVLLSLLLGYLTFSIISGIAGTSCSTMDDMQAANMNVMFLILACYLISVFTINIPGTVLATAVSVIPVLSVFCAPVEYVCGNIGVSVLVISWVIQIVFIWFLFKFCARIYEYLLLYKGRMLKLGAILKLAGSEKREGR